MDRERLDQRVKGRREAKEVISFICDSAPKNEDALKSYWECIRDAALEKAPLEVPKKNRRVVPMTDAEARIWGNETLRFGNHEGERAQDVLSYIDYMVGVDSNFMNGEAARFLLNEKVAETLMGILE